MKTVPAKKWRIIRWCLIGIAAVTTIAVAAAALIGLFCKEELWRGKRAWQQARRSLEAKGIKLDWASYIPAPVPDDQNVFGVPEMRAWFGQRLSNSLSKQLNHTLSKQLSHPFTGWLVVARITVGPPGSSPPAGYTALNWSDPRAKEQAARLIREALGPIVINPTGEDIILHDTNEIVPPRIFLRCYASPSATDLLQFLPHPVANTISPDSEEIELEPEGDASYNMTMVAPATAAQFLKWNEPVQPAFDVMREALRRPYARWGGDYYDPLNRLNFVAIRIIAQRLASLAQCHLLVGRPEEALYDLALLEDLRRLLARTKPVLLTEAMISPAWRIRGVKRRKRLRINVRVF